MVGATVLRGVESFGAGSRIHTAKILRLSEDLPLIVEIVDSEEKIDSFVIEMNELMERAECGGLVTEERAHIIRYSAVKKS